MRGRACAFLAQQAVEKHLKGLWVLLKSEPAPHTHSLIELGDGIGVPSMRRRRVARRARFAWSRRGTDQVEAAAVFPIPCRSSRRSIFPVLVTGSSSTNSTLRGAL